MNVVVDSPKGRGPEGNRPTTNDNESSSASRSEMWRPMRHTHFRRFLLAAVVSNAGSWMQSIAVPFTVYEITNSETWLGVTGFAGLFVSMIANTPGGLLADRYSRRLLLAGTQALQLLSALFLFLLWTFGNPTIATMMPLVIIGSVGGGLSMPVWQSFIPSLVPDDEVRAAIRLNSTQFAVARSIGPVLGAGTLKLFGASACFGANSISYLVIIAVLLLVPEISKSRQEPRAPLRFSAAWIDTVEGWRYLRTARGLMYAPIAVFMNASFGFGLTTLAPAFARDLFKRNANDNGILIAAFGIGGVVSIIGVGMFAKHVRHSSQVRVAFGAWTVGGAILALSTNFWIGFVAFAFAGCANTIGATALNTSVQMQVHDEFRGRVMGVYMQMFFLGSAVGSLTLGVLSDLTSLKFAAATSAAIFTIFHIWSARRFDNLRILDDTLQHRQAPPTPLAKSY
jgi:MFS family permease